jgi:DNA invertase Pin-like site-specific DNA recombinase
MKHDTSTAEKPVYDSLIRISKDGQRKAKGTLMSDSQQIESNRRGIETLGGRLGKTFEAINESGTTIFSGEKWQEALARVKRGESHGVAVAYLDRFGRDVEGAYAFAGALHEAGGKLIIDGRPLDPESPTEQAMFGVGMVMAQMVTDTAKQRSRRTLAHVKEKGIPIRPPYGYRRNAIGDGPRTDETRHPKHLVPDPKQAPVVKRIYAMRAEGARWTMVARWLEAEGIESPTGRPLWTESTISTLVRNRAYLGELRIGGEVVGEHEPLVDPETFDLAQPSGPVIRTGKNIPGVAGGLIVCASCGRPLSVSGRGTGTKPFYACRRRSSGGRCERPVTGDQRSIDETVDARLRDLAEGGVEVGVVRRQREVAEAREALKRATWNLDQYLEGTEGLPADRIAKGARALNEAVEGARERVEAAEQTAVGVADFPTSGKEWDDLPVEDRRRGARGVVERMELAPFPRGASKKESVAGERVTITWR